MSKRIWIGRRACVVGRLVLLITARAINRPLRSSVVGRLVLLIGPLVDFRHTTEFSPANPARKSALKHTPRPQRVTTLVSSTHLPIYPSTVYALYN